MLHRGGVYTLQRGGELDMIQRGVYIYHTGVGCIYILYRRVCL